MRIGFDARWYNDSGVGNYVRDLTRYLARIPDLDLVLYEGMENPLPLVEGDNVRKVQVRCRKYSVGEQFELSRRVHADRIDVFHSPFYVMPYMASCPVVVTIHDLIPFLFPIYGQPKREIIKTGYRLAAKCATRIIVDSQHTAEDLSRLLGVPAEKMTVVLISASSDKFFPGKNVEELDYLARRYGVKQPYVFVPGARNWKNKNIPTALKAVQRAQQLCGPFQTVISGPPESVDAACDLSNFRDIELVRTGLVPVEDLGKLYRHATIFLLASRYEGFGLPLLEAMMCGCAAVSSNGGSLREVGGDGALLFDPDDVHGMSNAITAMIQNPDYLQANRRRALQWSARFSFEKTAAMTASVYADAFRLTHHHNRSGN